MKNIIIKALSDQEILDKTVNIILGRVTPEVGEIFSSVRGLLAITGHFLI